MKTTKFIKFLSIASVVAMAAACSDEFPERETSPAGNENSMQVYFPTANKAYREVEMAETSVKVFVMRQNADEAAEVPLTVLRNDKNMFEIPATVSFAQGETEIDLDIPFSGEEIATEYTFEIKIEGDAYVNPYKKIDGVAHLVTTIVKLDWKLFASGTFTSAMFEQSWQQALYKAIGTNKYRFFDLYAKGYNFDFEWEDGKENMVITPTDVAVEDQAGNIYYGQNTGVPYAKIPGSFVYAYTDADPEKTCYKAEKDAQGKVTKEKFVISSIFGVALNGVYQGNFGQYDEAFEFTDREK
jgi:hypothetical protein